MSEADDQNKMKALETETETSSSFSSVKNDEKQKELMHNLSDQSNDNSNVNLGLSLGGLYCSSSGSSSSSGATPANVVVVGDEKREASRNLALCRAIHHTLFFKPKGHEVLPQSRLFRPQPGPIWRRPARSMLMQGSIAYAKSVAQRKLQHIMASISNRRLVAQNRYLSPVNSISCGLPSADRRYQYPVQLASNSYGLQAAEMIMFQDILGSVKPSMSWNMTSTSYAKPIAAGIKFGSPLVSNYVEFSGIMLQNGPASGSNGKSIEFSTTTSIQNASGSGSNGKSFELAGTMFQNAAAAGLDSNGAAEFAGTDFQNASRGTNYQNNEAGSGSNGPLVEFAGSMVRNEAAEEASKQLQNEEGGSSSNEKSVEDIAVGGENSSEMENRAKRVKLSNEGNGEDDMKVMRKMPRVVSRGNGRRIEGFLYKYKKGDVRMVCNCHGYFLNPTEFLKHAGATDLSTPMRKISVLPFDI